MEKDIMNNNPNFTINNRISKEDVNTFFNSCQEIYVEEAQSKVPVLGALAKLKKRELELIERKRLNNLVEEIQERLNNTDYNKISWTFFNSEEYARIVFSVYEKASKDYREEKLKYYANILVNYSIVEFSSDFYKEGIINNVSKYSIEHILILQEADNIYKKSEGQTVKGQFKKDDLCITGISQNNIELCILDLKSDGMFYEVSKTILGPHITDTYCITLYGQKCMQLIKDI